MSLLSEILRLELEQGVREGVFPSGAAAVGVGDEPIVCHETDPGLVYDVASLTKPFVATLVHVLVQRGQLALDQLVAEAWPEIAGRPVGGEPLRALLAHRSGLPAWLPLYERHRGLDVVLAATEAPLDVARPTYSDLGFMILGVIAERAAEQPLAWALAADVLGPLGLGSVRYGPIPPEQTLPTGHCVLRKRIVHGEVNDENAAAIGGVAGHAGLFAHVTDVCRFGRAWLGWVEGAHGALLLPDLARRAVTPAEPGTHALGWDTARPVGSSSGTRMGPRTFGHLGFTGCSLWIDPDARLVVALLTNRTHPTRDNIAIRAFRPSFHDAVVAAVARG